MGSSWVGSLTGAFSFRILERSIQVACQDRQLLRLLKANWEPMVVLEDIEPDLRYDIHVLNNGIMSLHSADGSLSGIADSAQLLHELETRIIITLQKCRAELLFVHAAALEFAGTAHLLIAESGGGKSTTSWALLHHGFRYLSDELAPVVPTELQVHTYQHAICLKQEPPAHYPLPKETWQTSATLHVPPKCVPLTQTANKYPLGAMWFLEFDSNAREPSVHAISPAEATARLYANGLNLLAHPNDGLDVVSQLASNAPAYFLTTSSDLAATSKLVLRTIQGADRRNRRKQR